jgi:carbon monoxide dehydrogenase subunit G
MLLKGDVTIQALREKVWDFLTDPNQIGLCVSGADKLEIVEVLKKYRGPASKTGSTTGGA